MDIILAVTISNDTILALFLSGALHILIGGVGIYYGVVYRKSLVLKYPDESEQLRNDNTMLS